MSAPLAELHLHLEGSIAPETLVEIDPSVTRQEVLARYTYPNFAGFIETYKWIVLKLSEPAHYALAARRLFEALDAQGVTYVEVNLSAGVILWKGQAIDPIFDALRREAKASPVEVRWIFDAVRQHGPSPAHVVAGWAVDRRTQGVSGFGFGGDETRFPASEFAEAFRVARDAGLAIVPHAGETSDARSVWDALALGAHRIGHGIRSIDDPVLCRHLADRRIPLEISISSNVATGAVPSLKEHPVRRLFDLGVPIVLNTDDPAMFHTTLTREYEIARTEFGFSNGEMETLRQNAFAFASSR